MKLSSTQLTWNRRVNRMERIRRKRIFKYILKIATIPMAIIIMYYLIMQL